MRIKINFIIFIVSILSGCNSWFDYTSAKWDFEPVYVSDETLSFGESTEPQILYISNNGGHSEISFSVSATKPWIVPSITSGLIGKGEDRGVRIGINRTLLPEGEQSGSLSVTIDGSVWEVQVTAVGYNDIIINPSYINLGSTDDAASFSLQSKSGRRFVELSPSVSWLSLSSYDVELEEYDINQHTGEKAISIKCNRSDLTEGEHSAEIVIATERGEHVFSLPISVTISPQDPLSVAIDNYVFTLSKHLYRNGDDVVLELSIKNHKYLKTFELVDSSSRAVADDNKTYQVFSYTSSIISPNEVGTMKIYIRNVSRDVKSFNRITLLMKDLSKPIVYTDVEL